MSIVRGQKIKLLTKLAQTLEGYVLSFSAKELWLQNEKGEVHWIPEPYTNLSLIKILQEIEAVPENNETERDEEFNDEEEEKLTRQGFKKTIRKSEPIEEFERDLPRLKQQLEERGISLEDFNRQYNYPDFGQYNVNQFPSTSQYSRAETPRPPVRDLKKMRRLREE